MADLVDSFESFTKSAAEFSWAVSVYALSQGARVVNGLPTGDPTATATTSFERSSEDLKTQLGSLSETVFNVGNALGGGAIGLAFNLAKPSNYNPKAVLETGTNLARWGLGVGAQFIPGGKVGNGGAPTGWGPVNREDAEMFEL